MSAKWDENTHNIFVELCEDEIRKGNRAGSHGSKIKWNNLLVSFYEKTGKSWSKKQLKNHWDQTKKEWTLFKTLIQDETGLGWNATEKTINVDDSWWEEKISLNKEYRKFRGRDLSLHWFRYDALFSDAAPIGIKAQPLTTVNAVQTQRSGVGFEDDIEEEQEENDMGLEEEVGVEEDENNPVTFPPSSRVKRRKDEDINTEQRKKRFEGGNLRENISDLVEMMKNSQSATATTFASFLDGPTIQQCLDALYALPKDALAAPVRYHASTIFATKEIREIFMGLPNDAERIGWLQYHYNKYN